jgi:predicted amidohydrolase YtcJ
VNQTLDIAASIAQRHRKPIVRLAAAFAVAAVLAAGACSPAEKVQPADLILTNGVVYTLDPAQSWAEAVAVTGDKIVFAGTSRGVVRYKGTATRTVDLGGRMVMPGFQDSHIHLISGGIESTLCNLAGLKTKEEVFAAIKDYADRYPDRAWVEGGRWLPPVFPQGNPRKEDLDRLVPDRPAYLRSLDGHSAWVNSRALKLAGITAKTPDPDGGRIERDPKTGEPSGVLHEGASGLVGKLVPDSTAEDYAQGLKAGLEMARRFGITSIIEASAGDEELKAFSDLDRAGGLTLRVLASLYADTDKGTAEVDRLKTLRETYRSAHLKSTTAKIFVDGVLESHTAALLRPYLDRPKDRGIALVEPKALDRLALALDAAGFQIHVHAIGDWAVRMTLDALEAAEKANGAKDLRHQIAHLELIDPADIPRFKTLGVVANFQPLWAYADPIITDLTLPFLDPARIRWLYPIGSILRTGAVIASGSDWPVTGSNPLEAIQVAVTRRGPDAGPGPAWIPEEVIDLPAMIAAYTANGAYLSHEETIRGTIAAGKIADLIVLDKNLFRIPAAEIHTARVLLTLFGGKEIYRDPGF